MNKSDKSDIIADTYQPSENSIRISRIDGILETKQRYIDGKWVHICRYPDCSEKIGENKNHLCTAHNKYIIDTNVDGEKIVRGDKIYAWSVKNKSWSLLCKVFMCKKVATKNGMCTAHNTNPNTVHSGQQSTINVYNELKNELNIEKIKQGKLNKFTAPS
jgi:hypothetical protein